MRGRNPYHGMSRAARSEIAEIIAQDPDQPDDDFEVDLLLIEPVDLEDTIDRQRLVKFALRSMTPRQERAVRLRHGLSGVGAHDYVEIADDLTLTMARAHQIVMRAYRASKRRLIRYKLISAGELRDIEIAAARRLQAERVRFAKRSPKAVRIEPVTERLRTSDCDAPQPAWLLERNPARPVQPLTPYRSARPVRHRVGEMKAWMTGVAHRFWVASMLFAGRDR